MIENDQSTKPESADEDFRNRVDQFLQEYKKLVDKFEIDLASFPSFVPVQGNGGGGFMIGVESRPVDMRLANLNKSIITKK